MTDQLILKFPNKKNYLKEDFYVSSSNKQAFNIVNTWPQWTKKNINIFGPTGSGKSHLVSIINDKASCVKAYGTNISEKIFLKFKTKEVLIIEDLDNLISENILMRILCFPVKNKKCQEEDLDLLSPVVKILLNRMSQNYFPNLSLMRAVLRHL